VRETFYDYSGSRWDVSTTCLERCHPSCSYYWDGAQSQSPPWWCSPYI
jgi:hypothetical protein